MLTIEQSKHVNTMFIGEVINYFESIAFSNVLEAKITKDGFDLVVDKGSYNHSIREFIERINTDEYNEVDIVDFPIEDWLIEPHPEKGLIYHFYDCFYYKDNAEELRKVGLQQKAEQRQAKMMEETKEIAKTLLGSDPGIDAPFGYE